MCLLYQPKNKQKSLNFHVCLSTYTPGHEVGETPIILFVEEQVTDPAAEGFLVVFVVDDFQHGLCVAWPWPEKPRTGFRNCDKGFFQINIYHFLSIVLPWKDSSTWHRRGVSFMSWWRTNELSEWVLPSLDYYRSMKRSQIDRVFYKWCNQYAADSRKFTATKEAIHF